MEVQQVTGLDGKLEIPPECISESTLFKSGDKYFVQVFYVFGNFFFFLTFLQLVPGSDKEKWFATIEQMFKSKHN